MVKSRRRAARDCIGKITLEDLKEADLADYEGAKSKPIIHRGAFSPLKEVSLCWSRLKNPEFNTINRDDTQTLDICRYRASDCILEFPTEMGWKCIRVRIKLQREYPGEILVTSANAEPLQRKFKLILDKENGDIKLEIVH